MNDNRSDLEKVAQVWLHSHEEDTPTTTVYRQASYSFPPSRGRKGFHLQPDGTMTTTNPGPTDQRVIAIGNWQLSGSQLELTEHGQATRVLKLESVESDRLVVAKS